MDNKFFDLQINGYAGVDFNRNELTVESLHTACGKLKKDGVKGILATIITADFEDMKWRLKKIAKLRNENELIQEIICGIHIEGPFLNNQVGFRGAHAPEFICPADVNKLKYLLDAAQGLTRIVTLSPEVDTDLKVTKELYKNNVVVSAGHCNPTLNELQKAIDAGLSMFTHFGNGCPNILDRHDNILQRVLSLKDALWISVIADGIHIPFYSLKNYLNFIGYEKSIVVTDAMAAAEAPNGKYTLSHLVLEVGDDRIVREPGKSNYAGSSISMMKSKNNLINILEIDEADVAKITFDNPRKAIGLI